MTELNLKEYIAEQIFPFSIYISGKFNHSDIIAAMCQMAEIFELSHRDAIIKGYNIMPIKHDSDLQTANDEIK